MGTPIAVYTDDVAGAEEKLKATVEPMRTAQWGGFYAKTAAGKIRKYDIYTANFRTKLPKLKDNHPELLECAEVCVQVGDFLRKEAQSQIMDTVVDLAGKAMQEMGQKENPLIADMKALMATGTSLAAAQSTIVNTTKAESSAVIG